MAFARTYALGLYHQRCGTDDALPYTRFTHDACHTAPAAVPCPAVGLPLHLGRPSPIIAEHPERQQPAADRPGAHQPARPSSSLCQPGPGGCLRRPSRRRRLQQIHHQQRQPDPLPHVRRRFLARRRHLDNLGIPESGDGISDVMQEAKWEADYLAKMQDADGGFYFLVYPQTREYEGNVHARPRRPAGRVAQDHLGHRRRRRRPGPMRLARRPSSGLSRRPPRSTSRKAKLGWQFLMNAIAKYGKNGAYQKITHYGDDFADNDELAWAACEMYLATGDTAYPRKLLRPGSIPADPATWRWGWWHMSECYGNAIRSYAFAASSGRAPAPSQLDSDLPRQVRGRNRRRRRRRTCACSQQSAYGTSFPTETKAVQQRRLVFLARPGLRHGGRLPAQSQAGPTSTPCSSNMNYEGGCNPVNVCLSHRPRLETPARHRQPIGRRTTAACCRPPACRWATSTARIRATCSTYGNELDSSASPRTARSEPISLLRSLGRQLERDGRNGRPQPGPRASAPRVPRGPNLAQDASPGTPAAGQIIDSPASAPVGALGHRSRCPGARRGPDRRPHRLGSARPGARSSAHLHLHPRRTTAPNGSRPKPSCPMAAAIFGQAVSGATPNIVWVDDSAARRRQEVGADGGDAWTWIGERQSRRRSRAQLDFQSAIARRRAPAAFFGRHRHDERHRTGARSTLTFTWTRPIRRAK